MNDEQSHNNYIKFLIKNHTFPVIVLPFGKFPGDPLAIPCKSYCYVLLITDNPRRWVNGLLKQCSALDTPCLMNGSKKPDLGCGLPIKQFRE